MGNLQQMCNSIFGQRDKVAVKGREVRREREKTEKGEGEERGGLPQLLATPYPLLWCALEHSAHHNTVRGCLPPPVNTNITRCCCFCCFCLCLPQRGPRDVACFPPGPPAGEPSLQEPSSPRCPGPWVAEVM